MREIGDVFWGSWIAWAAIWGATWRWSKSNAARQPPVARFAHLALVTVGSACCIASPDAATVVGRPLYTLTFPFLLLAALATVAGHALAVWARFTLGRNWSGNVTLKDGHELVERGPYRFVRHPIYTGLLLALLGTAAGRDSLLAFVGFGLVAVGFTIKFREEEKLLTGHFGAQYTEYAARVKGLIPFVW